MTTPFTLLTTSTWRDYALLDAGNGRKLERFGAYTLVRPEPQALWRPALPAAEWARAHGAFEASTGAEEGEGAGRWQWRGSVEPRWKMSYGALAFWVQPTGFRHLGVFPEQAAHWDWAAGLVAGAGRPVRVLNLFGYTGLFSLVLAQAGAEVTHVDASKKVMAWARENQVLAGLEARPIRWIVDDALKFVQREARRGKRYDGIILDPPKFGRGPQGEVWKLEESLPELLQACRAILSETPLFVVATAYAIRASAYSLHYALDELCAGWARERALGELGLTARDGRVLSTALFARAAG